MPIIFRFGWCVLINGSGREREERSGVVSGRANFAAEGERRRRQDGPFKERERVTK